MSSKEVKTEIQKLLENVPDNILNDILTFLQALNSSSEEKKILTKNFSKILKEDEELLRRLAE